MLSSLEIVKITDDLEGEVVDTHQIHPEDAERMGLIGVYKYNLELKALAVHGLSSDQYFIREVETIGAV